MIHKYIFFFILLCLFSIKGVAQDEKAHIVGHIRDGETFEIIPFAVAILYQYVDSTIKEIASYHTDQYGEFEFFVEVGPNYRVLGNAPEYLAREYELGKLKPGKEDYIGVFIDLEDILGYPAHFLNKTHFHPLKIRDADTEELVPSVEIAISIKREGQFKNRVWHRSYEQKHEGYFLPDEMYKIMINAPNYQEKVVYILFPSNKEIPELEFYLEKN